MHQDFLWCQVGYEASEGAGEGHRTTADLVYQGPLKGL